jgi:hypothetical protein
MLHSKKRGPEGIPSSIFLQISKGCTVAKRLDDIGLGPASTEEEILAQDQS